MGPGTAVLLGLLATAAFLYLLHLVVRAAVEQGVRRALRPDLLRPSAWDLVEERRQQREQGGPGASG